MGKEKTSPVAVRVELEREALQPGGVLQGTVYLSISQPIEAATLKLRVLGRQGLNWLVSSGHGMVARANKFDHLMEEIILAEGIALSEGDSLYPFAFPLPDDLQHNFVYVSRRVVELEGVRVSVQYEIETIFSEAHRRGSSIQANTPFRIDPLPMAVPFGRRVDATHEEAVKILGMFSRGTCGMTLSIDMDVLDSSSTIEAQVTLDLKTPQTLKYVALVLYEIAAIDRHNPLFPGRRHGSRPVCSTRLDAAEINMPNGDSTTGSTVLTIQLPLSPNEISDEDPLNPTMTSFFVEIGYRVAVEVKFPLAPRLAVGVPVTLIRKLVAPQELEVASIS